MELFRRTEQRKAALRRVEEELDEAEEIVSELRTQSVALCKSTTN